MRYSLFYFVFPVIYSAQCSAVNRSITINHDKTEVPIFHSKYPIFPSLAHPNGGVDVAPVKATTNLGLVFDDVSSFEAHINKLCKSSYLHLKNISRIRKYLTKEATETVVYASVTSKLDHCNSILYVLRKVLFASCNQSKIRLLQLLFT